MTCKDCYHYDVCHRRINSIDFLPVIKGKVSISSIMYKECDDVEKHCLHFKDKSRFVELPCKVWDTFFIISQRLEKGKYTEYFIDERQVSCFEYDGKKLTVYAFNGIDFDIDDIYFDKSKAEAKLKELNNGTT